MIITVRHPTVQYGYVDFSIDTNTGGVDLKTELETVDNKALAIFIENLKQLFPSEVRLEAPAVNTRTGDCVHRNVKVVKTGTGQYGEWKLHKCEDCGMTSFDLKKWSSPKPKPQNVNVPLPDPNDYKVGHDSDIPF